LDQVQWWQLRLLFDGLLHLAFLLGPRELPKAQTHGQSHAKGS
jgi:hypothetical protein